MDTFAKHATRWIGGNSHEENMGDAAQTIAVAEKGTAMMSSFAGSLGGAALQAGMHMSGHTPSGLGGGRSGGGGTAAQARANQQAQVAKQPAAAAPETSPAATPAAPPPSAVAPPPVGPAPPVDATPPAPKPTLESGQFQRINTATTPADKSSALFSSGPYASLSDNATARSLATNMFTEGKTTSEVMAAMNPFLGMPRG